MSLGDLFFNPGLKSLYSIEGFIYFLKRHYEKCEISNSDISYIKNETGIDLQNSQGNITKEKRNYVECKLVREKLINDINVIRYFGAVVDFLDGPFSYESLIELGKEIYNIIQNDFLKYDTVKIKILGNIRMRAYFDRHYFNLFLKGKMGSVACIVFCASEEDDGIICMERKCISSLSNLFEALDSYFNSIREINANPQIKVVNAYNRVQEYKKVLVTRDSIIENDSL